MDGLSGAAAPVADEAPPMVRVRGAAKRFGAHVALDGVSLDIRQGELFALLGASGCGKTTLLRLLAGFETADAGSVEIDGRDMAGVPPYRRPVNMMFQSYALFPHLSVEDNVAYGLRQDGRPRAAVRARVAEMLELVQMQDFARRKPHQLSGGQRQRVALARALARQPKVLLLDEPLAALDRKLRQQTQFELLQVQRRVGTTFVIVTHDQEEALALSSRIAVMRAGRIVQVGTPHEVYENPSCRFVADFLGQVNLFQGRLLRREGDQAVVASAEAGADLRLGYAHGCAEGSDLWVAVRPEKLWLADAPDADPRVNALPGRLAEAAYLGDQSVYVVRLANGRTVRVTAANRRRGGNGPADGSEVWVHWAADSAVALTE